MQTPDWLARRGGELRPGVGGNSQVVVFDAAPQYRLEPRPTGGKYGCRIVQSINGREVPSPGAYPSLEDAFRGGLEDLRKSLGW
jgi:hypothetical protein